MLLGVKILEI